MGRLNLPAVARATGQAPRCLDVAGGTGDIAFRMAESLAAWLPPLEEDGAIPLTVSDPNEEMLAVGRERQQQRGIDASCLQFEVGDAQSLPYDDETFDVLTISFGLRNVTDIDAALREMRRVLKKGGRAFRVPRGRSSPPRSELYMTPTRSTSYRKLAMGGG